MLKGCSGKGCGVVPLEICIKGMDNATMYYHSICLCMCVSFLGLFESEWWNVILCLKQEFFLW